VHLSADYWISKAAAADEILKNQDGIDALNDYAFANDPNMVDLASYPEQMSGEEVASIIRSISKPYDKDLFYRDGGKLTDADYEHYAASLDLDELQDVVPIQRKTLFSNRRKRLIWIASRKTDFSLRTLLPFFTKAKTAFGTSSSHLTMLPGSRKTRSSLDRGRKSSRTRMQSVFSS
jgi:hypothetical protein